jgi:hypothetical protein
MVVKYYIISQLSLELTAVSYYTQRAKEVLPTPLILSLFVPGVGICRTGEKRSYEGTLVTIV